MSEQSGRIGVIGAGNIGGAIAANLVADGHTVVIYDPDDARRAPLVAAGASAVNSPAEVARRSEVTFVSVPTPPVMQEVALDWLEGAAKGSVLVDLTTNSPAVIRDVGARLDERGCHLLECPLTGGAPGAKARMLVFMAGGAREIYERCKPLLDRLGRASFYMGDLGLGNTAKLVNSLLAFTATWVSLEGLAVAVKAGIDLRSMIEVIRTGGAGNFFTDRMIEGINERARPTSFSLALAAKDAGLLLDTARECGVPVHVAAQVAQVFVAAVGAGLGDRDFTDIVELIERQADVKLHLRPA